MIKRKYFKQLVTVLYQSCTSKEICADPRILGRRIHRLASEWNTETDSSGKLEDCPPLFCVEPLGGPVVVEDKIVQGLAVYQWVYAEDEEGVSTNEQ